MSQIAGEHLAVVVMAAGKGKRMGNPELAKVLTLLDGKPLLAYVLEQAQQLHPLQIIVIVGHQHEVVRGFLSTSYPETTCVLQADQLGTGHAVLQAQNVINQAATNVLILSGDVPLLSASTLRSLIEHHERSNATLTVLSTTLENPFGYGRVVRAADSTLESIVEQKDATDEQVRIDEINAGIYVVRTSDLFEALKHVQNANAQTEYYLTDIVAILKAEGAHVEAFHCSRSEEVHGINTVTDLERASQLRAMASI